MSFAIVGSFILGGMFGLVMMCVVIGGKNFDN